MNNSINKIFAFISTVILLSITSLGIRNILINNFDGYDLKIITIEHINNYGAAFSILQNKVSLLITVSLIILVLALCYIFKNLNNFQKKDIFVTALLSSGIICNLVERIIDGHVTDYIKLNFAVFPIFNISDIFICIGAFILICNILFNDEQTK